MERTVLCDAISLHTVASFVMAYYCRVKMLCLLIAHGIFLRQEASQSRRAIMKRVPDLQDPLGARSIRSQSGTRLSPRSLACVRLLRTDAEYA